MSRTGAKRFELIENPAELAKIIFNGLTAPSISIREIVLRFAPDEKGSFSEENKSKLHQIGLVYFGGEEGLQYKLSESGLRHNIQIVKPDAKLADEILLARLKSRLALFGFSHELIARLEQENKLIRAGNYVYDGFDKLLATCGGMKREYFSEKHQNDRFNESSNIFKAVKGRVDLAEKVRDAELKSVDHDNLYPLYAPGIKQNCENEKRRIKVNAVQDSILLEAAIPLVENNKSAVSLYYEKLLEEKPWVANAFEKIKAKFKGLASDERIQLAIALYVSRGNAEELSQKLSGVDIAHATQDIFLDSQNEYFFYEGALFRLYEKIKEASGEEVLKEFSSPTISSFDLKTESGLKFLALYCAYYGFVPEGVGGAGFDVKEVLFRFSGHDKTEEGKKLKRYYDNAKEIITHYRFEKCTPAIEKIYEQECEKNPLIQKVFGCLKSKYPTGDALKFKLEILRVVLGDEKVAALLGGGGVNNSDVLSTDDIGIISSKLDMISVVRAMVEESLVLRLSGYFTKEQLSEWRKDFTLLQVGDKIFGREGIRRYLGVVDKLNYKVKDNFKKAILQDLSVKKVELDIKATGFLKSQGLSDSQLTWLKDKNLLYSAATCFPDFKNIRLSMSSDELASLPKLKAFVDTDIKDVDQLKLAIFKSSTTQAQSIEEKSGGFFRFFFKSKLSEAQGEELKATSPSEKIVDQMRDVIRQYVATQSFGRSLAVHSEGSVKIVERLWDVVFSNERDEVKVSEIATILSGGGEYSFNLGDRLKDLLIKANFLNVQGQLHERLGELQPVKQADGAAAAEAAPLPRATNTFIGRQLRESEAHERGGLHGEQGNELAQSDNESEGSVSEQDFGPPELPK